MKKLKMGERYERLNAHEVLARATEGKGKLTETEIIYLADTARYLQKVVSKAGYVMC